MNQKLLAKLFYSNYAEDLVSPYSQEHVDVPLFIHRGKQMISIHDVTARMFSSSSE